MIAEWDAKFDDVVQGACKHMKEVAILTFRDGLVSSLREYWASESTPLVPAAEEWGQEPLH